MINQFSRTEILLGKQAMERLASAKVAIFGLGGVGSYAAEALARSGIGEFALFDNDKVCLTNINRQLIATHKTVDRYKTDVMAARIREINPEAEINTYPCFYSEENTKEFDLGVYDYIVDAIDTVSSKLVLILEAKKAARPIISCMGAGNKLNPTMLEIADIYRTSVCPLAKIMRHELRQRGVEALKVVYSKEIPIKPTEQVEADCMLNCAGSAGTVGKGTTRRQVPGSVSFVPPVAGLIMAGEVVRDLALNREEKPL